MPFSKNAASYLAVSLSVLLSFFPVLAEASERKKDDRYDHRYRAPLVIVPQDYYGSVEVYMTPKGYVVLKKKEEKNAYEKIEQYLNKDDKERK